MSHEISLESAVAMTTRFRQNRESIITTNYQQSDILAICETFDKDSVKQVLDQQGCVSFRIYYGMDESLRVHAILVGADSDGKDILPSQSSSTDPDIIMEDGQRCPHYCPPASVLNGE